MDTDLANKILDLYPEFYKVYGPYLRNDNRKIVILYDGFKRSARQYAKVLYEVSIKRRLSDCETIDHIDGNSSNDDLSNLRIISREENARIASLGNKRALGYKQTETQKRSGDKNGKALLSNDDVWRYRQKFESKILSKTDIIKELGMSRRAVENFLNYRTYK